MLDPLKVSCKRCGARYRVPTAGLSGKRIRLTCRACHSEIETVVSGRVADSSPVTDVEFTAPQGAWYAIINGRPEGPFSRDRLEDMLRTGDVHGDTHVWSDQLEDWQPLAEVSVLEAMVHRNQATVHFSSTDAESTTEAKVDGTIRYDKSAASKQAIRRGSIRTQQSWPIDAVELNESRDEEVEGSAIWAAILPPLPAARDNAESHGVNVVVPIAAVQGLQPVEPVFWTLSKIVLVGIVLLAAVVACVVAVLLPSDSTSPPVGEKARHRMTDKRVLPSIQDAASAQIGIRFVDGATQEADTQQAPVNDNSSHSRRNRTSAANKRSRSLRTRRQRKSSTQVAMNQDKLRKADDVLAAGTRKHELTESQFAGRCARCPIAHELVFKGLANQATTRF